MQEQFETFPKIHLFLQVEASLSETALPVMFEWHRWIVDQQGARTKEWLLSWF